MDTVTAILTSQEKAKVGAIDRCHSGRSSARAPELETT